MAALIVIALIAGLAIVFAGSALGQAVSSRETRALTHLISAHRFKGPLEKATSIGSILTLYQLDASGTRDASRAEILERQERLLADAQVFDTQYERYHWGVRAEDILRAALSM